jgi:hypothetical protein
MKGRRKITTRKWYTKSKVEAEARELLRSRRDQQGKLLDIAAQKVRKLNFVRPLLGPDDFTSRKNLKNELQIVAFCPALPIECWSPTQRCFLGRREQVLLLATRVFGNRKIAMRWLSEPALGLQNQAPCSILENSSGYTTINTFLKQLEHGIYV